MVSKSPKWGYSRYKWLKWLINGGDPNWDDPPSNPHLYAMNGLSEGVPQPDP